MSTYAVLDLNNLVVNRIIAESLEDAKTFANANCIECDGTSFIGDTWDGTSFVKPIVEEVTE